jgi:CPA2 family monovalent cation:H+ antiporter-2
VLVTISSFLTGYNPRTAVQAGMSLGQIGEFSFIIAAVGLSSGATRDFLYPVAVAVSAITTLTTPWLIRGAGPVADWVDRKLPPSLQTFVSVYGSWIERVRRSAYDASAPPTTRRLVRLLLIDAVLIIAVVIGAALEAGRFGALLHEGTGISERNARVIVYTAGLVIGLPLLIGLVRTARRLGSELAQKAIPSPERGVDVGAAPRGAIVFTLQGAILALVGIPIIAIPLPFLPSYQYALLPLILVTIPAIAFWRSTMNLQGHARAGAEIVAMTLASGMANAPATDAQAQADMERVRLALPGLGDPVSVRVGDASPASGRTLAELNVRGRTGATVLAILRDGEQVLIPSGPDRILAGDVLAIAGSGESVAAARELFG